MYPYVLTFALLALTVPTQAQQPTPFIPATHNNPSPSPSPSPLSSTSIKSSSASQNSTFSLATAHFGPTHSSDQITALNTQQAGSVLEIVTSLQSMWRAGAGYASITAAVFEAAPTTAQSSLLASGYNWDAIVAASWYNSVPADAQVAIAQQEWALQKAFDQAVTNITSHAPPRFVCWRMETWLAVVGGMVVGIVEVV